MKTPIALIVIVATCAASGYAGYYFGHDQAEKAAAAASTGTKRPIVIGGKNSAGGSAAGGDISVASLLKGPGVPDPDDLAAWAKSLSAKDCVDLVKQLQTAKGGLVRDTVLDAVLKSWAKSDPQGLLGSIDQLKSPHLREGGVDTALKALAMKDPTAALKWLKDNPGTASTAANQARYDAAIAGYAAVDPKGAFDTVSAMSDGTDRDKQNKTAALQSITDALASAGKFDDAQQLLATLPAGAMHDDAMDHLASSFASYAPDQAATWAAAITDPAERTHLEGQVADAWASSDPVAAATWAAQIDQQALANADPNAPKDPLNGPGMLLANAILSWSQDDLDGPGQFLNTLPDSPNKDRAVAIFAMHVGQEDPQSAANWIGTVSDPQMRQGVTMVVAMQMYQQDPATFTNFINTNNDIPDAQKQQLQQTVPMIGASMAVLKSLSGGKGSDPMSNIMESVLTGKSSPLNSLIRARGQNGNAGGNPFAPRANAPANNPPPAGN